MSTARVFLFVVVVELLTLLLIKDSGGYKYNEESCGASPGEILPSVNVTVPPENGNLSTKWFENETHWILQNTDVHFVIFCVAPYPVQLTQNYQKDATGTSSNVIKTVWNNRVYIGGIDNQSDNHEQGISPAEDKPKNRINGGEIQQWEFENDNAWSYRTMIGVKYLGSVCENEVSNFTCQALHDECLHTDVVVSTNKTMDVLTISLVEKNKEDNGLSTILKEIDDDGECDAFVSYWINKRHSLVSWRCEVAATGKQIIDTSDFQVCDSAPHCNTFYRHNRRGKKCIRQMTTSNGCFHCAYVPYETYKPTYLICRDKRILLAQFYFYSIPRNQNEMPQIYFDWSDADPQKMMYLSLPTDQLYFGDSVVIFCSISRYYFAFGHRFALAYKNGSIFYMNEDDGEFDELYNVNKMNITLDLNDGDLTEIFCFAPVWNSSEWINQSARIVIRFDPEKPHFSNTFEQELETIEFYVGEMNRSVICMGEGRPTPNVEWVQVVHEATFWTNMNESGTWTELIFPHATSNIEGDYICLLENFMGSKSKVYRVVVLDPLKAFATWLTLVASLAMIFCILTMIICWRTIKRQRKQIRLLTEAEVKEFLEGNIDAVQANDYLDTADLIHSLPYNSKYEIPKEMIHIDQSMVLGSGNFGQVLKGSIQLLDTGTGKGTKNALKGMSSIDVAVKTVKHNMEVLYFKTLLSEVKIMAHIGKHLNIVTLVGACTQNIRKREIFIAVEFCMHGSMESFLRKYRKSFVNLVKDDLIIGKPETQNSYENVEPIYNSDDIDDGIVVTTENLVKWSREIANGMEYLGSKKIIHGDLATRNIFLTEDLVVKIGDFGLSRQLLQYSNYVRNQECPLPWKWMALESLHDMKFSVHSDIWAYGVTIWEIFTLANIPYPGVSWSFDFLDQLSNGMRMHKPSYATVKIYNIMLDCWHLEPYRRPSFGKLKKFFEGIITDTSTTSNQGNYFQPQESLDLEFDASSSSPVIVIPRITTTEIEDTIPDPDAGTSSGISISHKHLSCDSGIVEDTQGYLLPLIDTQH